MVTDHEPAEAAAPTPVPFRAEVKQLLQILAHSLYTDREIFLRELLSNASDALHRVQFEMVTNREVLDAEAELGITITADAEARTISIADNGIGMTAQEMTDHLGTIAQSGARALMERLEASQRGEIIGQFGVGFYSAFVVADEVTVISRSYRPEAEAAMWQSQGDDTFIVGPAERAGRGTTVILKLKEDAAEFAAPWRLRQIVKRHSDYIAFPITIGEAGKDEGSEVANQQTALWRQPARGVEAKQYEDFYRQLTYDIEPPLTQLHLSVDAPIDLHTILFVPAKRERGLMERRIEGKIRLYSRKVLIQEEAKGLLPDHFRFIEGVVDSEDVPLNVARETVQSSQALGRIKTTLTGRLTKHLADLAEKDADAYSTFWGEFGGFIKEGVAADPGSRADLLPLLRFHTTVSEDRLDSLGAIKSRLPAGQSELYYVLAPDLQSARRSPHLEALTERGLEALLLVEMIDSFLVANLREMEGLTLRNADDPDLKLPDMAEPEGGLDAAAFAAVAERAQAVLGERVTEVRASAVLRGSPARLVSPESGPAREMARIQRLMERDFSVPARLLELNGRHPLVADLARLVAERPDDGLIAPLIEQLYDSALLLEGLHPDPAAMVGRIQALMEAAARGALPSSSQPEG